MTQNVLAINKGEDYRVSLLNKETHKEFTESELNELFDSQPYFIDSLNSNLTYCFIDFKNVGDINLSDLTIYAETKDLSNWQEVNLIDSYDNTILAEYIANEDDGSGDLFMLDEKELFIVHDIETKYNHTENTDNHTGDHYGELDVTVDITLVPIKDRDFKLDDNKFDIVLNDDDKLILDNTTKHTSFKTNAKDNTTEYSVTYSFLYRDKDVSPVESNLYRNIMRIFSNIEKDCKVVYNKIPLSK